MQELQEEDIIDNNLLKLFHLLHLLRVCGHPNYEHYGLDWSSRQHYIYRMLTPPGN